MKIYKVTKHNHSDSSNGFEFFSSEAAARKADSKFKKEEGENYESSIAGVEQIDIQPTMKGILAALNQHASHPDNG